MEADQVFFFIIFGGILCLCFLVKGLHGLITGRFVTLSRRAGALSWVNYIWARHRLRVEGEPFYAMKTGRSAHIWSVLHLTLGCVLSAGIIVMFAFLRL
ncbi:hypothetical protein ACFL6C_14415 [Myxococcota bacterium]